MSTTSNTPSRAWLGVPEIARDLGVAERKILGWIARGELAGVNVAASTSGRPRWRISRDAFDHFLAARQAKPHVPAPRRRRRQQHVTEFF
jgi:excisionase family DNA binding protein